MSDLIDSFQICSVINKDLKIKIKSLYIFDDENGLNVIFITNEDKVFGYGTNYFGSLGLGHNDPVDTPKLIPELCNKNIKLFFNGMSFLLALNDDTLYGMGLNDKGQLGRKYYSLKYNFFKPGIIQFGSKYFSLKSNFFNPDIIQVFDEKIEQVSCGSEHSLVLTSNNIIYGWGDNSFGQIGSARLKRNKVAQPTKLEKFSEFPIKSIYCSVSQSFALTENCMVYSWGRNNWYQLGHQTVNRHPGNFYFSIDDPNIFNVFEPTQVELANVKAIKATLTNTYFLLHNGDVYFCGQVNPGYGNFQIIPKLLSFDGNVKLIQTTLRYGGESTAILLNSQGFCHLYFDKFIKTHFKCEFEYYFDKQITENRFMDLHAQILNCKGNFSKIQYNTKSQFEILEFIGRGGFGKVFKVKGKLDNELYALKEIELEENIGIEEVREVKTMTKASDIFAVKFFNSWFENQNIFYILMELCFDNLQNIIERKPEYFGRKNQTLESMNKLEYYTSCQLAIELLECVNYLHESNPPIIHRDLKPANILVTQKQEGGRFVKLCDFGLATFDGITSMSHTRDQGTRRYMAPEVTNGTLTRTGRLKYNIKADVYSLCIILQELFDISLNSSNNDNITNDSVLNNQFNALKELIWTMSNHVYKERPTCAEVLKSFKHWSIRIDDLDYYENYKYFSNDSCISSDIFFKEYLGYKLSLVFDKNQ